MKFITDKNKVIYSDFESIAVIAFLKFDFESILRVTDKKGNIIDEITISKKNKSSRTLTLKYNGKIFNVDTAKGVKMLSEIYNKGIPEIVVDKTIDKNNKPLILICEKINDDIVNNCDYISYDSKEGICNVTLPMKNGKPRKFYFFESNNSLLIFNSDGFNILYGTYSSLEDVLTK